MGDTPWSNVYCTTMGRDCNRDLCAPLSKYFRKLGMKIRDGSEKQKRTLTFPYRFMNHCKDSMVRAVMVRNRRLMFLLNPFWIPVW